MKYLPQDQISGGIDWSVHIKYKWWKFFYLEKKSSTKEFKHPDAHVPSLVNTKKTAVYGFIAACVSCLDHSGFVISVFWACDSKEQIPMCRISFGMLFVLRINFMPLDITILQ